MQRRLIKLLFFTAILFSVTSNAQNASSLNAEALKERIIDINRAFNKVFKKNSTTDDVDALFNYYTSDFIYIHEIYGGSYSREELYNNTVTYLKQGRYKRVNDRYKIVDMIPGYNGIAVERELIDSGKKHLTVFEFEGDKVSKVIEYWK